MATAAINGRHRGAAPGVGGPPSIDRSSDAMRPMSPALPHLPAGARVLGGARPSSSISPPPTAGPAGGGRPAQSSPLGNIVRGDSALSPPPTGRGVGSGSPTTMAGGARERSSPIPLRGGSPAVAGGGGGAPTPTPRMPNGIPLAPLMTPPSLIDRGLPHLAASHSTPALLTHPASIPITSSPTGHNGHTPPPSNGTTRGATRDPLPTTVPPLSAIPSHRIEDAFTRAAAPFTTRHMPVVAEYVPPSTHPGSPPSTPPPSSAPSTPPPVTPPLSSSSSPATTPSESPASTDRSNRSNRSTPSSPFGGTRAKGVNVSSHSVMNMANATPSRRPQLAPMGDSGASAAGDKITALSVDVNSSSAPASRSGSAASGIAPPDSPYNMGPMPGLSPSPSLGPRITGLLGRAGADSPASHGHTPLASPGASPTAESPLLSWSTSHQHRYTNVADEPDEEWVDLDHRMQNSATYRELWRIVRMCSVQPSCHWMVRKLEDEVRDLVRADLVRVYLLKRDRLHRSGSKQSFPLHDGITGVVARGKGKALVNIVNPTMDPRWNAPVDSPGGGHSVPIAMLCLPIESNHRADLSGGKDVVAVIQCFKFNNRPIPGVGEAKIGPGLHDKFSSKDARVLYRLGEFVGNMLRTSSKLDQAQALYNASLNTTARCSSLLDVAKALASETDLDRIVSMICQQVPELLDADRCTLFFVDKEKQQLVASKTASQGRRKTLVSWLFGSSAAPELPFEDGKTELRLPLDKGLIGHVAMTGEVLNVVDAHLDKRFNSTMDSLTGYRTRSVLSVPMVDGNGEIIGVVQAVNKNPLYPRFDQEDEMMLKTFSAQAALAVRNSQLLAEREAALRQSDALLVVTNALAKELKIGALIKIIAREVQRLLEAERCTVYIVDSEKRELYTSDAMSFGMGPALPIDRRRENMIHFPIHRGIAGSVATSGRTVNIPDAYLDDRFDKSMDACTGWRTRSILCMAIRNHKDETVGVLQCMNKKTGTFDSNDEKWLSAFSAQAAVAIENSRLFQFTEKALNHALADQRNLKFMLSVTKNLFSDMHLTSMIDQMTMQVHHLLKADDCAMYLVDEKTKEFYLAKDDVSQKRYPFTTGLVGIVASTGQTIRISSGAHRDPRFSSEVDQRKDKITHSIMCCPIKAESHDDKSNVIGVISVRDEKDRGGFELEEEKLLKVFCAQAAVGIMNASRFASIMEQNDREDGGDRLVALRGRGLKLATEDIEPFMYKMDDLQMKGPLGVGSYGEVFRAVVDGQQVAVKKLHVRNLKAEQVEAFCNEASLMCQLAHPNVVTFIGAVTEPRNLCIITQYCARGSLADLLLDDSIEMNFALKLKFAKDAARGMLYLHTSNPVVLHRDLKSDNLLVDSAWTVKVADFGLTRFLNEKKAMTQVGTPMWMAPEVIMGRKYTEKADVYAFGIILWEIMTRKEPYEDKEPMQIVVEVVNDNLRPIISDEFKDSPLISLIKDCWAAEPSHRPPFRVILSRLDAIAEATGAASARAVLPTDKASPHRPSVSSAVPSAAGAPAPAAPVPAACVTVPTAVGAPASVPAVAPTATAAGAPPTTAASAAAASITRKDSRSPIPDDGLYLKE